MSVAEIPGSPGQPGQTTIVRKERSLYQESLRRLLKNRVAVISGIFLFILTFVAFVIAPYTSVFKDPIEQDLFANSAVQEWMLFLLPENAENYVTFSDVYIFGADHLGRDMLSRTIHGARVSLSVAYMASTVSLLVGILYGAISGYIGGWIDNVMMRVVDFLYGFPFLITVILLQAFFKAQARASGGVGFWNSLNELNRTMGGLFFMFIGIGMINWLSMARLTRGQILSYKKKEFVEAAHSLGASDSRIIFKHLLPNILGPLIVAETLAIPGYIFLETFLSFIGLGVDPPTPSWGIMISEAVQGLRSYPNQLLLPAVLLILTTLAFNFLGDGLRDAFDPRLKE